MKERKFANWIGVIAVVIFVVTAITFIFTPLNVDLKVLFAGSDQADKLNGNWIYNAFSVWDLKGVLYRLFLYIMYKFVTPFTGFSNYTYEVVTNLFFVIGTFVILAIAVLLGIGKSDKQKVIIYVMLGCSAIFASLGSSHIQAEMICVIKLLLAFGIYVNTKRNDKYTYIKLWIAGFIIGTMFFYKSVIILMSVAYISAIMIYNEKKKYKLLLKEFFTIVCGAICTLILVCLVIYKISPGEFQNMLDASVYQHTLFSSNGFSITDVMARFSFGFVNSLLIYPVVLIGFIFALNAIIFAIYSKDYMRIFYRIVTWGIPAIIIILANTYFPYHFFLFVFSGVIEMLLFDWTRYKAANKKKDLLFFVLILTMGFGVIKIADWPYSKWHYILLCGIFVLFVFVNAIFNKKLFFEINILMPILIGATIYVSYVSVFSDNFMGNIKCNKKMYETNKEILAEINDSEMVMYLDDGFGAYMITNKSYLEEHYPLPIQRIYEESEHENLECHIRTLEKALAYDGKYISVYEKWIFGENKNIALQKKISEEYEEIGKLNRWVIESDIFLFPSNKDNYFIIYQKK